jgi:NitT/TauT family transport system substrate-binding protein
LLGAGAALTTIPRTSVAQALLPIRLTGVPTDDLTPIHYALQNGLYKKAGIDLSLVPASSGDTATLAVVSGSYEMGKGSIVATLLAHLRNLPIVIAANGVLWDPKAPVSLACVTADSPIRTAADCSGHIGSVTALNDIVTLSFDAWLDKNGGDSRAVKWIEVPNSAKVAALLEHRIDFCSVNEPQLTAALETGGVRVLAPTMSAIAEQFASTIYFAHADFARAHRDAVRAFARVTYEAAAFTNAHPALTAPMMADVTKVPLEVMRKINRAPGATSSDPGLVQPVIDVAVKYKILPRVFPAREVFLS